MPRQYSNACLAIVATSSVDLTVRQRPNHRDGSEPVGSRVPPRNRYHAAARRQRGSPKDRPHWCREIDNETDLASSETARAGHNLVHKLAGQDEPCAREYLAIIGAQDARPIARADDAAHIERYGAAIEVGRHRAGARYFKCCRSCQRSRGSPTRSERHRGKASAHTRSRPRNSDRAAIRRGWSHSLRR
jgi:hypothetical protein